MGRIGNVITTFIEALKKQLCRFVLLPLIMFLNFGWLAFLEQRQCYGLSCAGVSAIEWL